MTDLLRDIETAANCLDRAGEFPTGSGILREAAARIQELETQLAKARAEGWRRGIEAAGPFHFERYVNGVKMAEGVCIERADTFEKAMAIAAKIASKGPKGEAPVLVYRADLARAALTLNP